MGSYVNIAFITADSMIVFRGGMVEASAAAKDIANLAKSMKQSQRQRAR